MVKFEDLTGQKFGRLTVIIIKDRVKGERIKWLCKCDCGIEKFIATGDLKSGDSKSCGCLKSENTIKRSTTHGHSKRNSLSSEYSIWVNMKTRCYNKNNINYKNYGNRGIIVCKRWLDNFDNFFEDMGFKPKGCTLDRVNNDKEYSKENCRWATIHQQCANRRSSNNVVGVFYIPRDDKWAAQLMVNSKLVLHERFKTIEEAIVARKQAEIEYNIFI